MCSTKGGSWEMYITFASTMRIRQNQFWLLSLEEMSPEIQNRDTSGLKIGHVNVSDKNLKKKKHTQGSQFFVSFTETMEVGASKAMGVGKFLGHF